MPYTHRPIHLALVAALAASLTAEAAEWVAEPSVDLRGEYNDNYRLTTGDPDTVWETTLEPNIRLSRRSDLWDISARERLKASQVTGQEGLDTVDNYLDVAAERPFERGSFNATASLVNDNTLQTEELDFDTGTTVRQIDRTRNNLRLGGNYMFTETVWAEASLAYATVSYDADPLDRIFDYQTLTPGLRIVHQYDQQTQVFGTLSHSDTKYDDVTDTEAKTDSLQLGAAYDITETWKVSASAGRQRTTVSNVLIIDPAPIPVIRLGETESTGLVYDASLARKFETGSLGLSVSQFSEPDNDGTSQERTRFNLEGNHKFSTKLSARLVVSYNQSSAQSGGAIRLARSQDVNRYRIAPSVAWSFDEELVLKAGYSYTRVENDRSIDDTTDSNIVFVSLGYNWPRMSVSR